MAALPIRLFIPRAPDVACVTRNTIVLLWPGQYIEHLEESDDVVLALSHALSASVQVETDKRRQSTNPAFQRTRLTFAPSRVSFSSIRSYPRSR